jgi:hypothetical protein
MISHGKTFDWVQFPEGLARFAGTFRCWDEEGRKTFALHLGGNEYFGEIKRTYLENHKDYNIFIDAFGYGRGEDVGMPGAGARGVFTSDEEAMAQSLVVRLIQAGLEFDDPPAILHQTESSRFIGGITLLDRWMLVESKLAGEAR